MTATALTITGPRSVPDDERPRGEPLAALAVDLMRGTRSVGTLYVASTSTGTPRDDTGPRFPAYRVTGTVKPFRDEAAVDALISTYEIHDESSPNKRGRSPLRVEYQSSRVGRPERPYEPVPEGTRDAVYDALRQITAALADPSGGMWEAMARFGRTQAIEDQRRVLTYAVERAERVASEARDALAAFEAVEHR